MSSLYIFFFQRWKLGQLNPGCTVQFRRISYSVAIEINDQNELYLADIEKIASGQRIDCQASLFVDAFKDRAYSSLLGEKVSDGKESFVLRQVSQTPTSAKLGLDLLITLTPAKGGGHGYSGRIWRHETGLHRTGQSSSFSRAANLQKYCGPKADQSVCTIPSGQISVLLVW